MRKDLNKILCEHPRAGSDRSYKKVRHNRHFKGDHDDLPFRESMKKRHTLAYLRKSLSENLNPLYREVEKNVGQPWDKFYSELKKVFDPRSAINLHIYQHLFDWIDDKAFIKDGKVCSSKRHSYEPEEEVSPFYVHPESGLLLANPRSEKMKKEKEEARKAKIEEEKKIRITLDEETELRRVDEHSPWFVCKIRQVPKTAIKNESVWSSEQYDWIQVERRVRPVEVCLFTGKEVSYPGYVVTEKKSASKKEIRDALATISE